MSSNSTKVSLWKLIRSAVLLCMRPSFELAWWRGRGVMSQEGQDLGQAGQQAVDLWSSWVFFTSLHLLLDLIFCWQWQAGSAWWPDSDCARGWRCSFAKCVLKMRHRDTNSDTNSPILSSLFIVQSIFCGIKESPSLVSTLGACQFFFPSIHNC